MSNIGNGLSLMMALKNPGTLDTLSQWLKGESTARSLDAALKQLNCVHYARLLPLKHRGIVLLIVEYDGDRDEFLKAFAEALRKPLTELLGYMKDWPDPAPGDFAAAFLGYANQHALAEASLFSGYREHSVDMIVKSLPKGDDGGKALQADAVDHTGQSVAGGAFNLVMELDEPLRLRELMLRLADPENKKRIDDALESLDYVHFARFLPIGLPPELPGEPMGKSLLLIVTEFDGVMQNYVMDFAAALDREFTMIIGYMKGRPLLPVSKHPGDFWGYVAGNLAVPIYFFSAYPGTTVLDVVGHGKPKRLPPAPDVPRVQVAIEDVQGNVLRGFGADSAFHYHLRFPDPQAARRFIDELRVTPASADPAEVKTCINIGFTHAGLQALCLDGDVLASFPAAFREGPARRGRLVGDADASDPGEWGFGGEKDEPVHAVVSLHCRPGADSGGAISSLETLLDRHGIQTLHHQGKNARFAQSGKALEGRKVHFGYRDGISQPRIEGVHELARNGSRANAVPGDFLLGADLVNSRGGRYIGGLPPSLAQNATYAAYRVMAQDVRAFETLLSEASGGDPVRAEWVAAKLMGRWRNGTPLTTNDKPLPDQAIEQVDLENFDYVSPSGGDDDHEGRFCPVGAHIRRFNPRSGMVLGVPWGRLVIRRGLPYGTAYDPAKPDDATPRGLVGMFICGDLESQFEFLLGVWGRQDLSSFGLRGTQDPITGSSPQGTPFSFTSSTGESVHLKVPPLTRTIGSLYLFMPGLKGLEWIAGSPWHQGAADGKVQAPRALKPEDPPFDPASQEFRDDPYHFFAKLRERQPVCKVGGGHNSHWVLSHKLVTEVCGEDNKLLFLKPGHNRDPQLPPLSVLGNTADGLFFMDPPRHTEIRALMDGVFDESLKRIEPQLEEIGARLLRTFERGSTIELVSAYAAAFAREAFMEIMGIPKGRPGFDPERQMVGVWTDTMLKGHDPRASVEAKGKAATASLALRAYLSALAREQTRRDGSGVPSPSIMAGLRRAGCPFSAPSMSPDEVTNTASHFALGGYLSTQFLITTGVFNLLSNGQWTSLYANRDNPEKIANALWEMLRFDAPFQMADRWVARNCVLGDYPLQKGDKVTVVYGSANRDPAVFADPDRFDIERPLRNSEVYGFGHGIHACIGAPLALRVAGTAIGGLVREFPELTKEKQGAWIADPYFRSLEELRIKLA